MEMTENFEKRERRTKVKILKKRVLNLSRP